MKVYHLKRTQFLPVPLSVAWDFFSAPNNLIKITPPEFGIVPVYMSGGEQAYEGQIICYNIRIMPGVTVHWVTEITHIKENQYFIDDQRFGPYAFWHHQHRFAEVAGGAEMTDEVNYAIPLGFMGRMANTLFVGKKVISIFDHRQQVLENHFGK